MKKLIASILALCMAATAFAGCGSSTTPSASAPTEAAATTESAAEPAEASENALPENYDLVITCGAETGSGYAMGIQIGEYINSLAPDITCTVKVGAATSNLALLSAGETVSAHSQADTIHEALTGTGMFTEPITNFYGVASVMESVLHVAVPADCPVNTFKEVVEQKYPLQISVGKQGSGIESLVRKIFEFYGVTYDDIASWGGKVEYLNIGDASTLFTDGQLNAVSVLAGVPYATISEVAASKSIKLLNLDADAVDALSQEGYLVKTIPADSYSGVTEDVSTVGVVITVCASADADENVIYEITKFLNSEEGIEILSNVNSGFANYMTGPESGIAGIEPELHPGAARFYREAGVID